MKKLIALISAIAVMGTMSLTSLAAIEVTPNAKAEGAALAKNATSGYDASYTSDKVNTQTTILAVKGTEITTTSIQYINQLAQDSETAINFDLKDTLAVGDVVNVYMGGDAIDKTLVGTITSAADPVVKYTVQFFNEDGIEVLGTISEVESGTALVAPAVPPKAADSEYTYEFAGWAVKGDSTLTVVTLPETVTENKEYIAVFTKTPVQSGGETTQYTFTVNSGLSGSVATKPYSITNGKIVRVSGLTATDVVTVTVDGTAYTAKYYTTPDGEVVHIVALVSATTITNDMISHTTGTPTQILFGDASGDGKRVNAGDVTTLGRSNNKYVLNGNAMSVPTEIEKLIVWDVDANGRVNAGDVTTLGRSNNKYVLNGTQLSLTTMKAYTIK